MHRCGRNARQADLTMMTTPKTIALVGKTQASGIEESIRELIVFLQQHGVTVVLETETARTCGIDSLQHLSVAEIGKVANLAIVLGGDGTMLGVARSLVNFDIPLIGINQGRFGFLADLNTSNMLESIDEIFQGSSYKDKRMLLQSKIFRGAKCIHESLALNDVEFEVVLD